jgi:hypothetical protein
MLRGSGFVIERAHGISYGAESIRKGEFSAQELATRRGLFDEVADCYLLAYVCRRGDGISPISLLHRGWWAISGPGAPPRRMLGRAKRRLSKRG